MKRTLALTIICIVIWVMATILIAIALYITKDPGCLVALLIPTFITIPCIVFMEEYK